MSESIRYGIDLGTTNSCIAACDGDDVRIFQNNDQMNVTPSAVRLLRSGRIIVGRRAYAAVVEDADNIAREFKRWMGQKDKVHFPASGRALSAEELSAEVLKSLREDVRKQVGRDLRASVITVPTAFTNLQCEATARAARMAGIEESPLLQEPIAAAIACGVSPGSKDQRWLVFDLGGGTLDIAVISTRDGRLTVLEHRGNNQLGGKDIDRRIVESFFLPVLQEQFVLPDPGDVSCRILVRRLLLKAEETKIDLSSQPEVVVSLLDLGKDQEGTPIETEITLCAVDLEREIDPLLDKCIRLAEEAMAGARVSSGDVDRILLVGGPTRMPYIRNTLSERLGVRVDHSLDPMTVVARGAAVYASTLEPASSTPPTAPAGTEVVRLAYDPVSAALQTPVVGRIERLSPGQTWQVKIDAEGGYWTSGWLALHEGIFEIPVVLQAERTTRFWLYLRDQAGNLVNVEPGEFSIRHGLVVSAPPLPHTISVEVLRTDGRAQLEPVFERGKPLPAESTKAFRAAHAMKPGNPSSSLLIKLWEGEAFSDPEANVWVGNMVISSDEIRRSVPEGAEVELHIKIDSSRLISVEAFIPHLNQHFSNNVYLAQREERDYSSLVDSVPGEIEKHLARLDSLEAEAIEKGDERIQEEVARLRKDLEDLDTEVDRSADAVLSEDPDRAKRQVEASREIRSQLSRLEAKTGTDDEKVLRAAQAEQAVAAAEEVVERFGSALEKREFAFLRKDLDRSAAKGDDRAARKTVESLGALRWRVLFKQDWFWREIFDSLNEPGRAFRNTIEAKRWLKQGKAAIQEGNGESLREAVRQLWKLQARSEIDEDRERALRTGLRKY